MSDRLSGRGGKAVLGPLLLDLDVLDADLRGGRQS